MMTALLILGLTILLGVPAALLLGIALGVSLSNRSWLMQLHEMLRTRLETISPGNVRVGKHKQVTK